MTSPFRFGLQVPLDPDSIIDDALAAEAAGFDIVTVADHIGPGIAPMLALSAIAEATSTIRLGTFVINAEFRNHVQLAWEAITLDRLSGGRFELGVGAGHTPAEFSLLGMEKAPARERKVRLAESVETMRRLFDGQTLSDDEDALTLDSPVQARLPVLVGGNGDALLRHAGAHADIVGLQGLGRTLEDGHRHNVNWTSDHLDAQVASIRAGADAAGRAMPELNALVQVVAIDDDPAALEPTWERLLGRDDIDSADHVRLTPYAMVGSVDDVVAKIRMCRERWGISYFVVRDREAFAPVVARLSGR